ncbi:MAG TPA: hypothetical protein VJ953_18925 [Saprospiraceae bacterium]|nr:hypothetical protein [Saprospiraceae bacterium]
MNKRWWSMVAIIFLLLLYLFYYLYHKPVPRLTKKKANFEFTAPQLYDQYQEDEANTDRLLLDKIILISGTVKTIIAEDNQLSVVLDGGNELGGVVCEMDNRLATPTVSLQPGQVVKMKGICTGMLMQLDIVLIRCVLIT